MFNGNGIWAMDNLWWEVPKWYSWLMLKLYILCLQYKIEPSIISPEIKNWILVIQVNWLVSTEFLIEVHWIENESIYTCGKCWMSWKYRSDICWVLCWYHYIILKTKILWERILLNFK